MTVIALIGLAIICFMFIAFCEVYTMTKRMSSRLRRLEKLIEEMMDTNLFSVR